MLENLQAISASELVCDREFWIAVTGLVPLFSSNYGLFRQALKSYRAKKMNQLSWDLAITFVITSVCCLSHALLIKAWYLALKDLMAFSLATTILGLKILYDIIRKDRND